jgi:hypothetical protein
LPSEHALPPGWPAPHAPKQLRSGRRIRGNVAAHVPPGIVPMLLRTRPVASGRHFGVHVSPVADEAAHVRGRLIVTAPKRVLKRAVERNAIRRVARESWRAAGLDRSPVVGLLRVRAAFVPSAPGAGLPARKRLAREELDRLFLATETSLRKRGKAR